MRCMCSRSTVASPAAQNICSSGFKLTNSVTVVPTFIAQGFSGIYIPSAKTLSVQRNGISHTGE